MSIKSKHHSIKVELPLSPSKLWDLLSNTDHLNRTIGLPPVEYNTPFISPSSFYRKANTKVFGFLHLEWKENLFEWIKPEYYSILREFDKGPFINCLNNIKLTPTNSGTAIQVSSTITYKDSWVGPFASTFVQKGVQDVIAYCSSYHKLTQKDSYYQFPTNKPQDVNYTVLDRFMKNLKSRTIVKPILLENLRNHLASASDELVTHMKPFALADQWGTDRHDTLKLFLYATQEGLLNLKWELICPNCRVSKSEYSSLSMLTPEFHCDMCGINYEADLDRYTEARFSINQDMRPVSNSVYCIGSPANSPHILIQQYLKPEAKHTFSVLLEDKPIRVRTIKHNYTSIMSSSQDKNEGEINLTYTSEGWEPKKQTFKPGRQTITLQNESDQMIVAVIEKVEWDNQAVSAMYITAMQEFRSLFGSEVLSPNTQISIQNLCVLFTDLKKSTLLYEAIGDAPAYGQVRKHFDFLTDIIQKNNGSIVKTIGDAVMAVFPTKLYALRSGIEIQSQINEFNRKNNLEPPIVVKLGIHYGPAIAVNANDTLDYFGRTVNIASRIQRESNGGDIILTREIFNESEIQQMLKDYKLDIFDLKAKLQDIEGTFTLCRLIPQAMSSTVGAKS